MERGVNRKYSLFVVHEYVGTAFVHYYYQLEMNIVIDVYTRDTRADHAIYGILCFCILFEMQQDLTWDVIF